MAASTFRKFFRSVSNPIERQLKGEESPKMKRNKLELDTSLPNLKDDSQYTDADEWKHIFSSSDHNDNKTPELTKKENTGSRRAIVCSNKCQYVKVGSPEIHEHRRGLFRRSLSRSKDESCISHDHIDMLHSAILSGKFNLVKLLVEGGTDVNGKTSDLLGNTPLMTTCSAWCMSNKKETLEIIRYLLDNNSDPYIENSMGQNCFEFAKKINVEFLNVEIIILVQQKMHASGKTMYVTGNIMSDLQTTPPSRRYSFNLFPRIVSPRKGEALVKQTLLEEVKP